MGRQLDKFLETVYGERAGIVYAATKQTSGGFLQNFFHYPDQRGELTASILNSVVLGEVYVCPSFFASEKGTKDQCLGSSVAWVDFDGNFPTNWPTDIPSPSMVVRTSHERRVHAYWKLDLFLPASEIEEINRRLSYRFAADLSGWDANQLLRPPETKNHKRGKQVELLTTGSGETYSPGYFSHLPNPPALPKNLESFQVPAIDEALANITWPSNLRELFENGLPEGKRSEGMFALAAGLAELNVAPQFILAVLLHSDNNAFHKFDKRPDQRVRLFELVTRAVSKVKAKQAAKPVGEEVKWTKTPISLVLHTESTMDWLLQPYIHKTTCAILSGPPGVGKSLMSLSLAQCLVLGLPFLGVTPSRKLKIGFVSLEMDIYELHEALTSQTSQFSTEELSLLEENLHILPFGSPRYFNDQATTRAFHEFVGDNHLDGVFVDSLSSTTPGDLSSEKETKFIFEQDANLRTKHGCFTWYIHHNRKAQADNKRPNKLADLHGSVHIQSKPSTILTLWPLDQKGNRISLKYLKLRSTKLPEDLVVARDDNLHYIISKDQSGGAAYNQTTFVVVEPQEAVVKDDIGSNDSDPPSDGTDGEGSPKFGGDF